MAEHLTVNQASSDTAGSIPAPRTYPCPGCLKEAGQALTLIGSAEGARRNLVPSDTALWENGDPADCKSVPCRFESGQCVKAWVATAMS